MIDENGDTLSGTFNYAKSLFKGSTIEHMVSTYLYLLDQFVDYHDSVSSHTKLSSLHLVREEDTNVISMGEGSYYEYDGSSLLHELFEHQVDKTPDHIALVYEDVSLTYQELNERSNQLAHYLLDTYKIVPDELIPLCLNRSEDMLIGILGVLKAGGAYVPMDPGYPMERIDHILKDTHARVILVEESTQSLLSDYKGCVSVCGSEEVEFSVVSLDNVSVVDTLSGCSVTNPVTGVKSDNLAYVIYTSGTTGKPKGVMIEHSGVVNLVSDLYSRYELTSEDVIFQFANYIFDASIEQMMLAILNGNKLLFIKDKSYLNEELFLKTLSDHNVSYIHLTPSILENIDITKVSSLRVLNSGGEALSDQLYNKLNNHHFRLVNSYGPTETTVTSIVNTCGKSNNIGRPISNTSVYVLDRYLRPVPVGAVGELYIGGSGLSRGYLNLPELTDECFVANPFQSEVEKSIGYNGRMYKTGDLGRFLPGGDLEYIGRNDFQVKIRGYRIELGEIENVLLSYEGIRQAVILAKENSSGLKYLVGYYVSDRAINPEDLSLYLSGLLPEYMVPSGYVHLEEFPLTINGKLDRRALPEPNFVGDREYVGASNDLEKSLVAIYGDVLGLDSESISIHDDFFRLGGNSIMAMKLIGKIYYHLKIRIKVTDIFYAKTIEKLSSIIKDYKMKYKPVVDLNKEKGKSNMFLIHPGRGGCDVYNSLAEKLSQDYHCYGIDSYNLYNEDKIDDLNRLALYYLDHIEEIQKDSEQKEYILLGWSLGGQIALEIASILEGKGHTNITVYLLDTILFGPDPELIKYHSPPSEKEISENYEIPMNSEYFINTKKFLLTEFAIEGQNISNNLRFTRVTLLKAMFKSENTDELISNHIQKLEYNNVEKIIENPDLLTVHPLNISHKEILKDEQSIIEIIKKVKDFKL
ncbi:Tyrocidine synthase 3 [Chryseobacterium potabilaquae]|uniref:Tyrocidine synthase 3 n=2 Tax=Chryseobacterium potabilaquae TaxID=2675057 RepID=A0A6N4XFV0_9FLAO|nr:Tyrocidine synthase 3 [Chryseobacterium potabilaquae]